MTLEKRRDDVRKIDEEIIDLLAKRMDLARLILEEKKKQGLEINDDKQNEVVIKRAMEKANELNIDTGAIKEIFKMIIRMSIERQHEMSGEGNLP
ncbi:chorismate mutase [Methanocella sp. CWC-04]|uniref:Chorismate mutase n=1 Tax=Methanooceanicella nereidis TaxID=2052831 RepID=A0AAP2W722_9EURY|nr:chorismate mutase [Methanocella sp. CWC-04]